MRHPATTVLLLVVAHLAFLSTTGMAPLNIVLAVAGVAAAASRGLIPAPRSVIYVLLLPVLVLPALPAEVSTTMAFGRAATPFLYRAILLASLETTLLSLLRWEAERQWWPVAAAMTLTMAAGLTFGALPYGGFVLLQMLLLVLHFRQAMPGRVGGSALAPLLAAGLLAATAGAVMNWSETKVNTLMAWMTPPLPVSAQFQAHSRLESMRDLQMSGRVVMRVLAKDDPPLHLAGACYLEYANRTWSQRGGLKDLPPRGEGVYPISDAAGSRQDRLQLSSAEPGSLFVPLGTSEVTARLASLKITPQGSLQFEPAPGFDGSYEIRRSSQEAAPAVLSDEERARYLQLPPDLAPVVREEAARRAPGSRDAGEIAGATENWLQNSFTYGLGYPFAEARDPLEQFLSEKPPAHCEFFATAMTLMLRARGVPARYVTGFLCFEFNPVGEYFTVRENHAHAWVEVHLPGSGWVTYDPTPPGAATQTGEGLRNWLRQWTDVLGFHWQRLVALIRSGDWRALLLELAGLSAYLPGVVVAGVLGWVVWSWRQRRRAAPKAKAARPDESPLPRLVAEFDRILAKRGLERPPELTLLEFRERLEEMPEARDFLEEYCSVRYGGAPPARLAERLEAVRQASSKEAR